MPMPTAKKNFEPQAESKYISAAQVCERYGNRSHMWLERMIRDNPGFPKPIKLGKSMRFFLVEDLVRFERNCAAGS
jgi:predicted DNA-binding transcriptional regulator AlpA